MKIFYRKTHKDGTVEVLTPHEYDSGKFRVEVLVDRAEMERLAGQLGTKIRMSGPNSPPSIVPPTVGK